MTNLKPVLASTVRAYFLADEKRLARLTEAEQVSVKGRGTLAGGVVNKYNKGRKPERQYVTGATKANAEAVKAQRAALVDAGLAGKRGPLSKAALASLKG